MTRAAHRDGQIGRVVVYQSVEDREGMVQARMADSVNEGFEQLDELLAKMPLPVG